MVIESVEPGTSMTQSDFCKRQKSSEIRKTVFARFERLRVEKSRDSRNIFRNRSDIRRRGLAPSISYCSGTSQLSGANLPRAKSQASTSQLSGANLPRAKSQAS